MALCNSFSLSGRIIGLSRTSEGDRTVYHATIAVPIQRRRIKALADRGESVDYGDCDYVTVIDYGNANIDWDAIKEGMYATFEGTIANRDMNSTNATFILGDAIFPELEEQ